MENPETTEMTESDGIKNLREAYEREKARADGLEATIRKDAFAQAGIDTETWVGQQLASAYDGELNAEAIRSFAVDKGIDLSESPTPVVPPAQDALNQQAAAQAAAQARNSGVMAGTTSRADETDPMVQASRELAEGRVANSIALKVQAARGER